MYETSSVNLRSLCPCLALAALLGGSGAFSAPVQATTKRVCLNPDYISLRERLAPLGDLIARGEGDYNAINRGRAGDTPGGIQGLTGMTFENYTVGQVMEMQRGRIFAVGRYQFIPKTLRFAVRMSEVSELDMFTPETQDKLMAALITHKRPSVGAYLRGDHDLLGWALDDMAREWASIEYRRGRGFYDHIGGNRAHISRDELAKVLKKIKQDWTA